MISYYQQNADINQAVHPASFSEIHAQLTARHRMSIPRMDK